MNLAAAELLGDRCRIVAVSFGSAVKAVVAHHECDLATAAVPELRTFRHANDLHKRLRVTLWPRDHDAGVTPIGGRPAPSVPPPSTLTIRERVAPLIRAGFHVTGATLPHEVLAELALQHGTRLAVTLAFHATGGCLAVAHHGRAGLRPVYLRWDADWCQATAGAGDALARYEFAAAVAPHIRQLLAACPEGDSRILACGSMANLRTAMAPFSEEFGREIEILDHPWPGLLDREAGTIPVEPATWQIARAAAQAAAQNPVR
jgi:hypothetical protein